MRVSLTAVLVFLSVVLSAAAVCCGDAFFGAMNSLVRSEADNMLLESAKAKAVRSAGVVLQMCELAEYSNRIYANTVKETFLRSLETLGQVSRTKPEYPREIRAGGDFQTKKNARIPLLKFGNTLVDCAQTEPSAPVNKLLSELKERLHADFTIFVKTGDGDTFLRLASTYTDIFGESIAGSYIESDSADAAKNKMIETVLEGGEYSGIVDSPSGAVSANYIPLRDASGEIVGIAFFGTEKTGQRDVGKYVSALSDKSGYSWVLDISKPDNPVVKISGANAENPSSIKDEISAVRKNIAYEIIEKSRTLRYGQVGCEVLGAASKKVVVTYAHFRPWHWVIGSITDFNEFSPSGSVFKTAEVSSLDVFVAAALFSIFGAGVFVLGTRRTVGNFKAAAAILKKLASGDVSGAVDAMKKSGGAAEVSEELSGIYALLKPVAARLETAVEGLKNDAANTAEASAEAARSCAELAEANQSEFQRSKEIARGIRDIHASAKTLGKAAEISAAEIQKSLDLNRDSETAIASLMRKYNTRSLSAGNVTRKLSEINENAEKISALITTISDVSLKTNMLSLNASIEAEKVGESGLGFAVVSRQIRRLADKTSKASKDMEEIVGQMQSSVNTIVMEMDRFGANIRANSLTTVETADKLSSTISNMEGIGPKFDNALARISELTETASNMADLVNSLSCGSEEINKTLSGLADANASIKEGVRAIAAAVGDVDSGRAAR